MKASKSWIWASLSLPAKAGIIGELPTAFPPLVMMSRISASDHCRITTGLVQFTGLEVSGHHWIGF